MFWTWNSGYIAFKMEGRSPESAEPAHTFSYHIGGYRSPYGIIRTVTLRLANNQTLHIGKEGITHLEIPLELDRFFDGKSNIRIKDIPACTTPGGLALRIFENFTGVFEEVEIQNENVKM
ncbi:MAG: MbnP family protein, partial [Puia sp.]